MTNQKVGITLIAYSFLAGILVLLIGVFIESEWFSLFASFASFFFMIGLITAIVVFLFSFKSIAKKEPNLTDEEKERILKMQHDYTYDPAYDILAENVWSNNRNDDWHRHKDDE
jgi:glucan phosphoethanolaminetransferase (alkaline phosphatase superfamily)